MQVIRQQGSASTNEVTKEMNREDPGTVRRCLRGLALQGKLRNRANDTEIWRLP
jgi:hypothetical protein